LTPTAIAEAPAVLSTPSATPPFPFTVLSNHIAIPFIVELFLIPIARALYAHILVVFWNPNPIFGNDARPDPGILLFIPATKRFALYQPLFNHTFNTQFIIHCPFWRSNSI
jgi:hypothetical protein